MSKTVCNINKDSFSTSLQLVALRIPATLCSHYLGKFNDYILHLPKTKRIYDAPNDPNTRLLLLKQNIALSDLPTELQEYHAQNGGLAQNFEFKIDYDNLSVEDVLKRLLPAGSEVPCSFEQAGHIAHLNIRGELLPYKNIIAQVIRDKNPSIRTVVNKVGNIETEFRTFPMEVLSGDDDFNVTVKESGAIFNFNFKEVYWNSRLQMEHLRIVRMITSPQKPTTSTTNKKEGEEEMEPETGSTTDSQAKRRKVEISVDEGGVSRPKKGSKSESNGSKDRDGMTGQVAVIADMMAGVGPFAVPLARASCHVYANDLNPASFRCLTKNAESNRCTANLTCFNMDGRQFILHLIRTGVVFQEVVMNLPQSALDFLDVFVGLETRRRRRASTLTDERGGTGSGTATATAAPAAAAASAEVQQQLPRIHVYAFSSADDPVADVCRRAAQVLGCDPDLLRYKPSTEPPVSGRGGCGDEDKDGAVTAAMNCVGHIVRDVAPKKQMVCMSFYLPSEVALAEPIVVDAHEVEITSE